MPQTYTVKQVAQILGYSTNSIYSFLKAGRIKSVRVGKGRFRIPQVELDRLLLDGKNKSNSPTSPVTFFPATPDPPSSTTPPVLDNLSLAELTLENLLGPEVPSLFNWFIGAASLLLGISLFLFDSSLNNNSGIYLLPWINSLKACFLAGGTGFLLCHTFSKDNLPFQKIFHIVLLLSYLGFALILGLTGNILLSLAPALLGLFLIPTFFLNSTNQIVVPFLNTFLVTASIIGLLLQPLSAQAFSWLPSFFFNSPSLLTISILFVAVNLILLFVSSQKFRPLFWVIIASHAFLLIVTSYQYAKLLYWYSAFLFLFTACFTMLIPFWHTLRFKHHSDKIIRLTATCVILLIFIAFALTVHLLQKSRLSYAEPQASSKLQYAKLFIQQNDQITKHTIETVSQSPVLAQALTQSLPSPKNELTLTSLAKTIFVSNGFFRRVLILNSQGDVVAHYPYDPALFQQNFAYRDYFKEVVATHQPFQSQISETVLKTPAVVISSPIFDTKQNFVGVLVGSLNLENLGFELQKMTSNDGQENFVLVDNQQKFIIHPKPDLVGQSANQESLIHNAFTTGNGIGQGFNQVGTLMLQAYDQIPDLNWGILLQTPLTQLLRLSLPVIITFYIMVIFFVSLVVVALVIIQKPLKTSVLPPKRRSHSPPKTSS